MTRPLTIVFIAVTALGCAALIYLQRIGLAGPAAAAKTVASVGFLVTAVSVGALRSLFGRLLLAGLIASFAGDVFLIGDSRNAFLAGLGSFLAAHLLYIAAFTAHGLERRWLFVAIVPLVAMAIAVTGWLRPHLPPDLALPVYAYIVAITAMVITAFGARGAGAPALVVFGAILFFLSDLSVAALRIVATDYPTYTWGLPAYYAGQLCFAVASGARYGSAGQSSSQ